MTVVRREVGPVIFPEIEKVPSLRKGRKRFVSIFLGHVRRECSLTAGESVDVAGGIGDAL